MINTAEQRFVKGTEEYVMFNDFWKLCQSFLVPEDTDEYWKKLKCEQERFKKDCGSVPMTRGLSSVYGFVMKCVLSGNKDMMNTVLVFMELFTESQFAENSDEYWKYLHDRIEQYVKEVPEDMYIRKIREMLALISMNEAERKLKEQEEQNGLAR